MNVGKDLKKIRLLNNLSQEEIAEILSVSRQTIARWENNKTQPQPELLRRINKLIKNDFTEQKKINYELSGIWMGYVYQIMKGLPNNKNHWYYYPVIMNKQFEGTTVCGNAIVYFYTVSKKEHRLAHFATDGYTYSPRHYKINYRKAKTFNAIISGVASLIYHEDKTLRGPFSGFGYTDEEAVQGEVFLKKISSKSSSKGLKNQIIKKILKTINSNNYPENFIPDIDSEIGEIINLIDTF